MTQAGLKGQAGQEAADSELNPPPTPATPAIAVTRDEVRHVAALASLELTPSEEERIERDLNAILGYVAELNELDTANVEPMAQVSEILRAKAAPATTLRADEPRPSLARQTVMAEAPATDGIFFKVPKVIER
jgi:aspartyl-tRNA(Asn)/glutamyl-tRNA(Gln) amidotransferase subunit C